MMADAGGGVFAGAGGRGAAGGGGGGGGGDCGGGARGGGGGGAAAPVASPPREPDWDASYVILQQWGLQVELAVSLGSGGEALRRADLHRRIAGSHKHKRTQAQQSQHALVVTAAFGLKSAAISSVATGGGSSASAGDSCPLPAGPPEGGTEGGAGAAGPAPASAAAGGPSPGCIQLHLTCQLKALVPELTPEAALVAARIAGGCLVVSEK
ncbi:hypothetical protein FOA52_012522 [Chlamydomonas sp. UWO 241]|nr:hypothetical protein FOA52_012522 [Chlamydomonas sp. UWO 241]